MSATSMETTVEEPAAVAFEHKDLALLGRGDAAESIAATALLRPKVLFGPSRR
jgi:hypothetical protein